jgi:hypothetical protein
MITPKRPSPPAPKPPLVGRLLRGISKSRNLEKTYQIFGKMFKPLYSGKNKLAIFLLWKKFLNSPDK